MYLVLLSFPFRVNQYEVFVLYATLRMSIVLIRVRVMLIGHLHVSYMYVHVSRAYPQQPFMQSLWLINKPRTAGISVPKRKLTNLPCNSLNANTDGLEGFSLGDI
jgi:hypothetical protein